ncbi:MAG: SPOR domain-containing protein [Pseudomonadota bacterium]
MPQDHAKRRPAARKTRRARSNARDNARDKKSPQRYFHGPSFSGGIVLGALLVITTAYLPELLPRVSALAQAEPAGPAIETTTARPPGAQQGTAGSAPQLRFEYPDLLKRFAVPSDPGPYEQPLRKDTEAEPRRILLQAASFRTQAEANQARATILLLNLPATTRPVWVRDEQWFRVTVGPFPTEVQAQRAMTALREQAFAPLWFEGKAT